jgi:hypothetical protein
MSAEPLYEGPAHDATFFVPSAGTVRFNFSELRATGYVRSQGGAMAGVHPGARMLCEAGQYVLVMYDPKLVARVSITFEPR